MAGPETANQRSIGNASDLLSESDKKSATALREARRLFYVGVTRPGKERTLIFESIITRRG
jgi:superfamily I DNA/RNA helicase